MVIPNSVLGWFNALMPRDFGTRKLADGLRFGPHDRHILDIYAPKKFDGALPVLNFVYGGGWNSGTRKDYAFVGHAFAAAGFLTVIADYRIVPEVHYPAFLEDGGLALKWINNNIAAYGGEPASQVLAGHSAGAYNAVMLGLVGEEYGAPNLVGRMRGVIGLSGPYDFFPFDVKESIDAFSSAADPELTQPINLVSAKSPPMFLGHGTKDTTCLPRNTRAMAEALRAQGVEVVEKLYDGADHALPLIDISPLLRWRTPVYRDMVSFMRRVTAQSSQ